jgi:NADPH:quinone reductase-like Zn-dependent oxidoreductase
METMMALRAHERGGPEVLRYDEAPRPVVGNGEVLVEVHAAAVTPGELSWDASWLGEDGTDRTPMIPSHEFSGVVFSTAAGFDDVRAGDEVYGLIEFHRDGAAAEYVALPPEVVVGRPLALSHVESAALPLAALTAWQALTRHAHVQRGDRVFIQGGAGGVGSLAVQLAKSIGATVSATAIPEDQPLVRSLGADAVVESRDAALPSGEPGFDVLLNTFGGPVPTKSYDLVRPGGRLVTLAEPLDTDETNSRGIEGIFFVVESDTADLRRIATLVERGALRPVIARTFPLSEASKAYGPPPSPHRPGKTVLVVRP